MGSSPLVVVVGAGPAGLVLAWLLHRAGVPFQLVESQTQDGIGTLPKAGIVEHRVARLLAREGLDEVLDLTVENRRVEFRAPGTSFVLDYADLTGDRPHYVLPQHRLVACLAEALVEAGAPLRFSHRVVDVRVPEVRADGARPAVVVEGSDGARQTLEPEVVVGADGATSVVARALARHPARPVAVHDRPLPSRWLVVSAPTPPLVGHTIYAAHPDGFAAHLRRGPQETRFYLEVPGDVGADDRTHDDVRAGLGERLGVGTALDGVPLSGVDALDLRTRMTEPLQYGGGSPWCGLVLVGDAAHLITPAGGKGMNLAIGDAVELAHGLVAACGPERDAARLDAYSATRLPVIWRMQAFSDWFLRVLSAHTADAAEGPGPAAFVRGTRDGWVRSLRDDPLLARWFAHAYAGVDPDP